MQQLTRVALALLAVLSACVCQAAEAAEAEAVAPERFLWTHWYNPAGFGDSVRDWYEQLATAKAVRRTLVLPPFVIERVDLTGVKQINPSKILARFANKSDAELNQHMHRLSTRKHCYNILHPELVAVSDWFDLATLAEYTPVVSLSSWNSTTDGQIDALLTHVTGDNQNCLSSPEYEYPCRYVLEPLSAEEPGEIAPASLKLTDDHHILHSARREEELHATDVFCVDNTIAQRFGLDSSRNSPEKLSGFLQHWSDAKTLGIDIHCPYNFFKLENAGQVHRELRRYFRFSGKVLQRMRSFLQTSLGDAAVPADKAPGAYIAFHWRRGDVSLNHASTFLKHTPEAVVTAIAAHLQTLTDLDVHGFVLMTDCPYERELERIEKLVKKTLNLPFTRYTAKTQADSLVMDLALGSYAKVLFGNYGGSFYANFMAQERELLGFAAESFVILQNLEHPLESARPEPEPGARTHDEL